MKLLIAGVTALALAGCVMPGMPGMGAGGMGGNPEEAKRMSADLQQAQAAGAAQANRPGDDKMDCPAIQAEMMAQMQDPKFKAAMASMGGRAQDMKARQDAAQARGSASASDQTAAAGFAQGNGADMMTMMPQIMRGQRLNELATAKKCTFLTSPAKQ